MSKTFRAWTIDQPLLLPLAVQDFVANDHLARFVLALIVERVDFMSIVALDPPDFRTIATFRKRHLKALSGLFVQVLKLCEKAGLVKLGHVALDGTKIKANASKHRAQVARRAVARR